MESQMRVYAKVDGDSRVVAWELNSVAAALVWCENIVYAIRGKSITSELNCIQASVDTKKNPAFKYKDTMPLEIINLVLKQYNLELVPDSSDKRGEEDNNDN